MTVAAIGKSSRINGNAEAEDWLCTSLLLPFMEGASRFVTTSCRGLADTSSLPLPIGYARTCLVNQAFVKRAKLDIVNAISTYSRTYARRNECALSSEQTR